MMLIFLIYTVNILRGILAFNQHNITVLKNKFSLKFTIELETILLAYPLHDWQWKGKTVGSGGNSWLKEKYSHILFW